MFATRRRWAIMPAMAVAVLLAGTAPAWAHVTVVAPGAVQGGEAVLTFRVPTESAAASTVGLRVQLPPDQPLGSVAVQAKTGWTVKTVTRALATPIKTDDGEVTQAVAEIDWVTAAGAGIRPGQFDDFSIEAGPLPRATSMVFKVIQHYSDGTDVAWIEQAAAGSTAEPEHPAPTLTLAPAGPTPAAASTAAASAAPVAQAGNVPSRTSVTTALVLGGLGLLLGVVATAIALTSRRRTTA